MLETFVIPIREDLAKLTFEVDAPLRSRTVVTSFRALVLIYTAAEIVLVALRTLPSTSLAAVSDTDARCFLGTLIV